MSHDPEQRINLTKATVLVVDASTHSLDVLGQILRGFGVAASLRCDSIEETEKALRIKTFDLIICDLKMPRVGGMEFYRELETSNPEMTRRIMFVTGDVAGTDAERFLEETGTRWLAKPFRLKDLLRDDTSDDL